MADELTAQQDQGPAWESFWLTDEQKQELETLRKREMENRAAAGAALKGEGTMSPAAQLLAQQYQAYQDGELDSSSDFFESYFLTGEEQDRIVALGEMSRGRKEDAERAANRVAEGRGDQIDRDQLAPLWERYEAQMAAVEAQTTDVIYDGDQPLVSSEELQRASMEAAGATGVKAVRDDDGNVTHMVGELSNGATMEHHGNRLRASGSLDFDGIATVIDAAQSSGMTKLDLRSNDPEKVAMAAMVAQDRGLDISDAARQAIEAMPQDRREAIQAEFATWREGKEGLAVAQEQAVSNEQLNDALANAQGGVPGQFIQEPRANEAAPPQPTAQETEFQKVLERDNPELKAMFGAALEENTANSARIERERAIALRKEQLAQQGMVEPTPERAAQAQKDRFEAIRNELRAVAPKRAAELDGFINKALSKGTDQNAAIREFIEKNADPQSKSMLEGVQKDVVQLDRKLRDNPNDPAVAKQLEAAKKAQEFMECRALKVHMSKETRSWGEWAGTNVAKMGCRMAAGWGAKTAAVAVVGSGAIVPAVAVGVTFAAYELAKHNKTLEGWINGIKDVINNNTPSWINLEKTNQSGARNNEVDQSLHAGSMMRDLGLANEDQAMINDYLNSKGMKLHHPDVPPEKTAGQLAVGTSLRIATSASFGFLGAYGADIAKATGLDQAYEWVSDKVTGLMNGEDAEPNNPDPINPITPINPQPTVDYDAALSTLNMEPEQKALNTLNAMRMGTPFAGTSIGFYETLDNGQQVARQCNIPAQDYIKMYQAAFDKPIPTMTNANGETVVAWSKISDSVKGPDNLAGRNEFKGMLKNYIADPDNGLVRTTDVGQALHWVKEQFSSNESPFKGDHTTTTGQTGQETQVTKDAVEKTNGNNERTLIDRLNPFSKDEPAASGGASGEAKTAETKSDDGPSLLDRLNPANWFSDEKPEANIGGNTTPPETKTVETTTINTTTTQVYDTSDMEITRPAGNIRHGVPDNAVVKIPFNNDGQADVAQISGKDWNKMYVANKPEEMSWSQYNSRVNQVGSEEYRAFNNTLKQHIAREYGMDSMSSSMSSSGPEQTAGVRERRITIDPNDNGGYTKTDNTVRMDENGNVIRNGGRTSIEPGGMDQRIGGETYYRPELINPDQIDKTSIQRDLINQITIRDTMDVSNFRVGSGDVQPVTVDIGGQKVSLTMSETEQEALQKRYNAMEKLLDREVDKGNISGDKADQALNRFETALEKEHYGHKLKSQYGVDLRLGNALTQQQMLNGLLQEHQAEVNRDNMFVSADASRFARPTAEQAAFAREMAEKQREIAMNQMDAGVLRSETGVDAAITDKNAANLVKNQGRIDQVTNIFSGDKGQVEYARNEAEKDALRGNRGSPEDTRSIINAQRLRNGRD